MSPCWARPEASVAARWKSSPLPAGACGRWRCRPTAIPICCCGRPRPSVRGRSRWPIRAAAARQDWSALPAGVELLVGPEAVAQLATDAEVDIVVSAIVGSAGLQSTWAALDAGKTVALANKESLVVGGPLVTELARRKNAKILPVDSEHSAVFQAMQAGRRGRGAEGDSYRQRGAFSHVLPPNSLPKLPWPTPWPIRLGRWGRKLRSIRPR